MSASTAIEGLVGQISLNGTFVGYMTGVTLSGSRTTTPFRGMGTYNATQILKGVRNFEGTAKKAYLCGDMLTLFLQNCTEYAATLYPRGTVTCNGTVATCGTIAGSIALKSWSLTGMETESEAAVIEEIAFDMYSVTQP